MSRDPDLNYEIGACVAMLALGKAATEWAQFWTLFCIAAGVVSLGVR